MARKTAPGSSSGVDPCRGFDHRSGIPESRIPEIPQSRIPESRIPESRRRRRRRKALYAMHTAGRGRRERPRRCEVPARLRGSSKHTAAPRSPESLCHFALRELRGTAATAGLANLSNQYGDYRDEVSVEGKSSTGETEGRRGEMIDTPELFKRDEDVHWSRDVVPPLLRWNGLVCGTKRCDG